MAQQRPDTRRITRRQLLQTSAAAGVGGLALGAVVGYGGGALARGGAAGPAQGAGSNGPDIKVVGIIGLQGVMAADGKEIHNGNVMAIDDINQQWGGLLGRKINYVEIDDGQSSADEVTTAFNRAVEVEKPDVIFSGYHLGSGPEFDILAKSGTLYYNGNTQQRWVDRYKQAPDKYWSIFQADPTDTMYGKGFAIYLDSLVKDGKYTPKTGKTAAILYGNDAYDSWIAKNFEEKVTELGWKVTYKADFTAGQVSDWGPLLSKVRDNPPGILFTTDYVPAEDAALAKTVAANPLPCLVYEQYGPSVPEFLNLAGEAANGIIWATVLGRVPDQMTKDWMVRYKAKFNADPGWAYAPGQYDAILFWAKAAALAGDPKDYKKIAKITEQITHRGYTGTLRMVDHAGVAYPGETNDPSLGQAHIFVQIQGGQHKVIGPTPWTDGEFQLPPWLKG